MQFSLWGDVSAQLELIAISPSSVQNELKFNLNEKSNFCFFCIYSICVNCQPKWKMERINEWRMQKENIKSKAKSTGEFSFISTDDNFICAFSNIFYFLPLFFRWFTLVSFVHLSFHFYTPTFLKWKSKKETLVCASYDFQRKIQFFIISCSKSNH